jgi:MFS family permease
MKIKDDETMNRNLNRLTRNIPLFYVYQLLNSFILDRGIWMLFLLSRGFSLAEIGLIEMLYHGVVFLFEIPTGYLADRYGKRFSLLLAQAIGLASAYILLWSDHPMLIVGGFMLGGLVGTLQSGATSAIIYDTLRAQREEHRFKRLNSHLSAVMLVSMGLSGAAGGYLSDIRWEWVYAGKMMLHFVTFLVMMAIREPLGSEGGVPQDGQLLLGSTTLSFAGQLKEGYVFLKSNRPFLYLSFFGALLYSMSWSVAFYSQVLFQQAGFGNTAIGTFNGAETWISAAVAAAAYIGERMLGKKGSLLLSAGGYFACLLLLSSNSGPASVVASFFLMAAFISYLEPLLEAYLNELVPSSMRATMLSVFGMMISTGMMATFLTIGVLADRYGLSHALRLVLTVWTPAMAFVTLRALRSLAASSSRPQ